MIWTYTPVVYQGGSVYQSFGYVQAWAGSVAPPTPPSGQIPRASRYRSGYQTNWVTGLAVLLVALKGVFR